MQAYEDETTTGSWDNYIDDWDCECIWEWRWRCCYFVAATLGIDESAGVELKQPSRVDELVEDVELILKCRVDGNAEPTVDWYRNYDR